MGLLEWVRWNAETAGVVFSCTNLRHVGIRTLRPAAGEASTSIWAGSLGGDRGCGHTKQVRPRCDIDEHLQRGTS